MYDSELTQEPHTHRARRLDENVWRAWQEKNRLEEMRNTATRMKVVKWLCIGVLVVTAVLFSYLSPYGAAVRSAVTLGALIVMIQGLHTRRYAFAALFAAIVVLYNPLFPTFTLSGGWQRLLVLTSAVPFVASLAWMNATRPVSTR